VIAIPSVSQEHLDYFDNGSISFFVYALQEDSPPDASVKKLTTKVIHFNDFHSNVVTYVYKRMLPEKA